MEYNKLTCISQFFVFLCPREMAIDMIATTTANIHDLDAEINVIRERIKQGIAMTEGELDVYQPNVVRRETLHDQLTTMRVECNRP
ncbi:unnamed protein product [Rotaria socialis]|uniref:Uncharacterized protein n=1 Tax=Rotaria socialis TaxID=392032 RepID=A0A817UIR9_9BILA|nr:unnamed protein product [Rotaria socialis]